jgi:mannose-6-phosphate isomerase-like protein (cupin superfamily)
MKRMILGTALAACMMAAAAAQGDLQPTCRMCPGSYIPNDEIQAYVNKAIAERRTDQQVRDIDIGKSHVGIGIVHRGRLAAPAPESVAEHDLVSEVYHIIDGTATLVLGPDLVGKKRRPADLETVRLFNGPGNNAASVRNGVSYDLKAGDVVVIPAGTGHWFTKIDDHITYLMVRIDPDKVTPLKVLDAGCEEPSAPMAAGTWHLAPSIY